MLFKNMYCIIVIIFFSGEDDDLDSVVSSSGNFTSSHSTSAENTIIHSTDSESEEEAEVFELLKKDKPKHTWFMTPEVMNRQIGNLILHFIYNICV